MTVLHAQHALLPEGWADEVQISVALNGRITNVQAGIPRAAGSERVDVLVPGVCNTHSHAFQRALAGRAEIAGHARDTFWTWRTLMYRFVQQVGPDELRVVATMLYVDMLKAGYTSVGEFHYLHHAPDGVPYEPVTAASEALIEAAHGTGIELTLLPVLYMHGDFGGAPPQARQKRFVCGVEQYLELLGRLRRQAGGFTVGIAFHSLRAVLPEAITIVLTEIGNRARRMPVHIHAAEQHKEVQDCRAWSGRRPVEWLLEHGLVDARWCVVHATHMTQAEARGLAEAGGVVALCPTTEANLGDGLFPLTDYLAAGGHIAIGSDSHVSISPTEELRWLEYGQRLKEHTRNVAATRTEPHTGARLFRAALGGGAHALGQPVGHIEAGYRANLVELDASLPALAGCRGDVLLDCLIFACNANAVRSVMVGGRWVVRDGHHALEGSAAEEYRRVVGRLAPALTHETRLKT